MGNFVIRGIVAGTLALGAAPGFAEDMVLNIQDSMAGPNVEVIDGVYAACSAKIGATLNVSRVPGAGIVAKILQQAATKTLPDVTMIDNPDVKQIAAAGILAPIEALGVSSAGFLPGAIEAGTHEGKLYALPPIMNTLALFYNTDLLESAGVAPPKTWDELKVAAEKLTVDGRYGLAFAAPASLEGAWQFLPFMWSNGGDETDIATPAVAEALQLWVDLVEKGHASKSVVTWTQGDLGTQFVEGAAAMVINGPWSFRLLEKNPAVKWATVPVPTPDGARPIVPMGGQTFAVPETGDAARMQKAAQFVSCVIAEESQVMLAKGLMGVPALPSAAAKAAEVDARYLPFVNINEGARARTGKLGAAWPDTAANIYEAIQLALTGEAPPAEALEISLQ